MDRRFVFVFHTNWVRDSDFPLSQEPEWTAEKLAVGLKRKRTFATPRMVAVKPIMVPIDDD